MFQVPDTRYRELGFRLARIAAAAARNKPCTESLLEVLMSVGQADAAVITVRDDDSDSLRVLAVQNYCAEIVEYVSHADVIGCDMAYRSILRNPARSPLRTWDDPDYGSGSYRSSAVARQLLLPSGFHGGMSARLTAEDGTHVGNFHMNTREAFAPGQNQIEAFESSFGVVATLLGNATRTTSPPGSVVVIKDGKAVESTASVPGTSFSGLVSLVQPYAGYMRAVTKTCNFRWRSPSQRWFRVDMRSTRTGLQVLASCETLPYQLTCRELDVLDRLCVGATNRTISAQLQISERTVAHHVERILGKLEVPTRTAAAVVAIQEGLTLRPTVKR